ncbi:hypothetical protein NQ318_001100 [Aromia moschata]|uniref:Dihydrolipoamide acetyltransferase component of pyruvate dehydrogenase complex n=1 Tax=Aromia moschata TaxID=1265417 RepID=A0AAV8ZEF0_9CUCU|nr:hypothetical protein NQ318_001100 [Aromia moschata]
MDNVVQNILELEILDDGEGFNNPSSIMSSMLSLATRKIPRCVIRSISNYLEKDLTEVPLKYRTVGHGVKVLRKYNVKTNNALLARAQKSVTCQHERYFQTTIALLESQTVKTPNFPESVTEGDVRLDKKVGDHVAADEVVMEIETDKTAMPVHSPGNGIIEEILVKDGDTVKAGHPLFKINITGEAPAAKAAPAIKAPAEPKSAPPPPPAAAAPPAAAPPPPPPPPPSQPSAPPAAAPPKPAAPMTSIPVAAIRHAQALEAATVKVPPQDPTKEISGTRTEQRVKMNRMRLKIASRLKEAQNTNAMLTTFNEIDMAVKGVDESATTHKINLWDSCWLLAAGKEKRNIMEFRKLNQEAFQKKHGLKLSFMSAFLKASAYALQDQPVVNAVIEGQEIIYRDYVDISVAVATPKGLVVPVIRNVERMDFADIERAMAQLGDKARKGQLAIEDMDGGTFTISNGGVFGSLMGTPIINPPQSAILGMHAIFERPVALKGQIVIRPMMYVALTYDHRLIDGREAVLFLRKIKQGVEDPRTIIAGL